ncbi:MAG: hypothetical protein H6969_06780 [Gammaproteobacteria bacterium]|nr:hypothetical protein [Gammaproteobacteria bacterium]
MKEILSRRWASDCWRESRWKRGLAIANRLEKAYPNPGAKQPVQEFVQFLTGGAEDNVEGITKGSCEKAAAEFPVGFF